MPTRGFWAGFREVFAGRFLEIDHRSRGVSRKSHQAKAREIFARPCVALAFFAQAVRRLLSYLMFLSRSVVASAILIPTLVFAGANPPQAPKKPHEITEVGHTRNDPSARCMETLRSSASAHRAECPSSPAESFGLLDRQLQKSK
jgi:hypothetical protein